MWHFFFALWMFNCFSTPVPFIEKTIFSPWNCFSIFVRNHLQDNNNNSKISVEHICVGLFLSSLFYSILFIYVSILPQIPHSHDYSSYRKSWKSGRIIVPTLIFCFITVINYYSLHFHINFIIILSIFTKKLAGMLIEIALYLYINLVELDIFWAIQSMIKVKISIYLNHLSFLSWTLSSFQNQS